MVKLNQYVGWFELKQLPPGIVTDDEDVGTVVNCMAVLGEFVWISVNLGKDIFSGIVEDWVEKPC